MSPEELLLKEKLLSHLIPIGKWGSFWLKAAAGELQLGYRGSEEAIFEWRKSPAPFYPAFVGYTSLIGHTIGVKFPCSGQLTRPFVPSLGSNKSFSAQTATRS